jgi:pyroglutamyl-peptidase
MKTLLLTGFEPFLSFPINPTEHIVTQLDGAEIGEFRIKGQLLPVDYKKASSKVLEVIHETNPDIIVSLGLAAGRSSITPERIAINCRDGEPDNNGVALQDSPIYEDGPDGYFSRLPIRKMVDGLKEKGYPAKISDTAGTYLCNNIMYVILHETNIPAGFVHIPASHQLAAASKREIPSWSNHDLTEAIRTVIEICSTNFLGNS